MPSENITSWDVIDEDIVFDAQPWLKVRRQCVRTERGQVIDDYYQVDLPDFVIAVALTVDRQVITLWQYKHGAGAFGLTFPAGIIDCGEQPEAAMRRELLEETGFRAGVARFIGRYACSSNQGAGWAHLFVLTDCESIATADSGDLETMELRLLPIDAVDQLVVGGSVNGLPHLAVWTAAKAFGHLPGSGPA